MAPERVIGVDLGGTKILAGVVDRGGTVERRREQPTPLGSQYELLRGVAEAELRELPAAKLAEGQRVELRELPVRRAGIYAPGGRAAYPCHPQTGHRG